MVTERKIHEAETFLNKKGKGYAINNASPEERQYFDGILYNKGVPSFALINYSVYSSHALRAVK